MKSYDYVIVGAGTSGCVLAHGLATRTNAHILVLEAGGPATRREVKVPAAFSRLFKTSVDWSFFTEPEKQLNDRKLYWPRGKMLGGCSSINAMIYIRGHKDDYDRWAADGNSGWSFRELLPLFKASERNSRGASEWHGADGPLSIVDPICPNKLTRSFIDACVACGIPHTDDFNGEQQEGAGFYQVTQENGLRHSAADAFLRRAVDTGRVDVLCNAQATRIVIERATAVGVEYIQDNRREIASARSEVIIASGAVQSPQLLMLSGVGPGDHLRSHGIPVVVDLPDVGANLQDHLAIGIMYHCKERCTLDSADNIANLLNFITRRRGPLTSNVAEGGAFLRSDSEVRIPDLQLLFAPSFFVDHGFSRPGGPGFSIGSVLLRPESRGRIRLHSPDPFTPPRIEANYLSTERDREVMLRGLVIARNIAHASAFDRYRGAEYLPGDSVRNTEGLLGHLRARAETMYHPVGTCRMGPDAQSVVDPQLQVRGVNCLRVVDASIMPTLVGGNTNAPAMVIAEKAVAMMTRQDIADSVRANQDSKSGTIRRQA